MPIVGAQLITQISIQGADTAKSELGSVDKKTTETQGFLDRLKHGFEFGLGLKLADIPFQAMGFLRDQIASIFEVTNAHQGVMAQMDQVLKSTGDVSGMTADALDNLAQKLGNTTRFSADTVQGGENLLLTFTNIGKGVFPQATQAILDVSQAMGQDLKESAIQVGKALGDPLTGMTALQRIGVTFSASEKEQIKTMMAHNNIMGAQKVILKELATEFGGSAQAAAKTFGGQVDVLKNHFEEFKIKIGTAVLPILTNLLDWITSIALPGLERFGDWFSTNIIPKFQAFGTAIGNVIGFFQKNQWAVDLLAGALLAVAVAFTAAGVAALVGMIPALITQITLIPTMLGLMGLWIAEQWALLVPILATAAPFILIGVVVAAVVAGVILAIKNWGAITTWLGNVWHTVFTAVGDFFSMLGTKIHGIIDGIIGWFNNLAGVFKVIAAIAIGVLSPIILPIAAIILAVTHWASIMQWFAGIWNAITTGIGNAMSGLGSLIHGVWDGIVSGIKNAINWVISLINGFISGIDSVGIDFGPVHIHANIPTIPYLQSGGFIVSPGLAYLHAGETVVRAGGLGAGVSQSGPGAGQPIILQIDGYRLATVLLPYQVQAIRNNLGVIGL